MESYILRAGQKTITHSGTSPDHMGDKMAPGQCNTDTTTATGNDDHSASQLLIMSQEDSMDIPAAHGEALPSNSPPLIDYKQLAIEVAM